MKQALILLPGTLCTAALFEAQTAGLATAASVQVIPLSYGRTVVECAAWIIDQAPPTFALGGFSQGAVVALEVIRQAPERVLRLALMAANARGSSLEQLESWSNLKDRARRNGLCSIVDTYFEAVAPGSRTPELYDRLAKMAEKTGAETFVLQLEILASRNDSRPFLAQITCPTLIVAGDEDPLTPVACQYELASRIPGATLSLLAACGHYSPLEKPAALTNLLYDWLTA